MIEFILEQLAEPLQKQCQMSFVADNYIALLQPSLISKLFEIRQLPVDKRYQTDVWHKGSIRVNKLKPKDGLNMKFDTSSSVEAKRNYNVNTYSSTVTSEFTSEHPSTKRMTAHITIQLDGEGK